MMSGGNMYEVITKAQVEEVVKEWERKGGRTDYVGNLNRRYLGVNGLLKMLNEFNVPMSLRPYYYDVPTYIERRLMA